MTATPPAATPLAPAMQAVGADQLLIDGIHIEADIGFAAHEQGILQPLEIDLVIDRRPPTSRDDGAPTLDYRALKDELRRDLLGTRFNLIESLAEDVARRVLAHDGVLQVAVTVHKPGALTGARGVAARITRTHA